MKTVQMLRAFIMLPFAFWDIRSVLSACIFSAGKSEFNNMAAANMFHNIHTPPEKEQPNSKITVVGVGAVGMACAFSILTQTTCSDLAIVDVMEDKLRGEMLDLQHGSFFMRSANINAGSDYSITANSRIIVITAGARQREGETRLDLVQRNADILKDIIPKLMKYNTNPILLIVSNPVDVLTQVAWKVSGLPKHQVIGSGTNLDSLRFRFLLSKDLGISVESVHGFIIGEHGDSSVPVWSGVNVAGTKIQDIDPNFVASVSTSIHKQVVNSAYEIIKLKGSTSWAIGLSVTQLVTTMMTHRNRVHAVTTCVQGVHGINDDVFLSLPCVLGPHGVQSIVKQPLSDGERGQLIQSASALKSVFDSIKW